MRDGERRTVHVQRMCMTEDERQKAVKMMAGSEHHTREAEVRMEEILEIARQLARAVGTSLNKRSAPAYQRQFPLSLTRTAEETLGSDDSARLLEHINSALNDVGLDSVHSTTASHL